MPGNDQIYLGAPFTNSDTSPGGLNPGDVVQLDLSFDASVRRTTTANSTSVFGIIVVGGSPNSKVIVASFRGQRLRVNVSPADTIARGDKLVSSATAGLAKVDNAADDGSVFAVAITDKTGGSGTSVECLFSAVAVAVASGGDSAPSTRVITAGAGLTGGGDLSVDRTINAVANADGSIVVNANDIQVGVISDAQHGNRGGGSLHALATESSPGFMSAADKILLDSGGSLATTPPVNVTKAAAVTGIDATSARRDHKHDVDTAAAVDIGTANTEGNSTSLARANHTHNLPFVPVQTALAAASGPVSVNSQQITNQASGGTTPTNSANIADILSLAGRTPKSNEFWVYTLDYDGTGSDTTGTPGISSVSMATALAASLPLKTFEKLGQILPRTGNGATLVVLVKPRASAANYRNIANSADADGSFLTGLSGWHVEVRGSLDFANDSNDKIRAGFLTASGTNSAGYKAVQAIRTITVSGTDHVSVIVNPLTLVAENVWVLSNGGFAATDVDTNLVMGGITNAGTRRITRIISSTSIVTDGSVTTETFNSGSPTAAVQSSVWNFVSQLFAGGAPSFPAEGFSGITGLRIRFSATSTTTALQNLCVGILKNTGNMLKPMDVLPAFPGSGDPFFIEVPGVSLGNLTFTAGFNRAFSLVGLAAANTSTIIYQSPNSRIAGCSFGAALNCNDGDAYAMSNSYLDEADASIIVGTGVRVATSISFSTTKSVAVSRSAWLGTSTVMSVSASVLSFGIGAGCVTIQGIVAVETHGPNNATWGSFSSATIARPRIYGANIGGSAGVHFGGLGARISGTDFSNCTTGMVKLNNTNSGVGKYYLDDLVSPDGGNTNLPTDNTAFVLSVTETKQSDGISVYIGTNTGGAITATADRDIICDGGLCGRFVDLNRQNLAFLGIHIYGGNPASGVWNNDQIHGPTAIIETAGNAASNTAGIAFFGNGPYPPFRVQTQVGNLGPNGPCECVMAYAANETVCRAILGVSSNYVYGHGDATCLIQSGPCKIEFVAGQLNANVPDGTWAYLSELDGADTGKARIGPPPTGVAVPLGPIHTVDFDNLLFAQVNLISHGRAYVPREGHAAESVLVSISGTIVEQVLTPSTLLGRGPTGDVTAVPFSTLISGATTPGAVVTGATSGSTNLGSFTAGVLQQTIASSIATITPLLMLTGQIPFGLSSGLLGQDSSFVWDNPNKRLGIGTNTPGFDLDVTRSTNTQLSVQVKNANAGSTSAAAFSANNGTAVATYGITGTGFAGAGSLPNLGASTAFVNSGTSLYLGATNVISLQTGATQSERLRILATGELQISSLNAGGVVHAAVTTGQLSVGTINTADITNNAVDNTKLADMASARFKARITAGSGDPEDITGTQATTLLDTFTSSLKGLTPLSGGGTANFLRADGVWTTPPGAGSPLTDGDKGDIVVSTGGTVWTIDAGVVTNANHVNMATARFKARVTAGAGSPEDVTGTQATTLLDVFTPTLKGLTPASSGGTTNFLRADGTWTLPPGFALTDGDKGDIVVSGSGATWTIDTNAITATKILDGAVTFLKIDPIRAGALLGNDGDGTGNKEIVVRSPLQMVVGNGELTFATGFTPGAVIFQGSAQIAQDATNFFWNDTNNRLGIGTNVPGTDLDIRNDASASTIVMVRNQGTGASALAQFVATNSPGGGVGIAVGVAGTNFTATVGRPLVVANTPYIVPYFGSGNLYMGAPGTLIFATGTTEANRLQILSTGQVNISSLSASGVVTAASSTGQLAVTTMVAGRIPFGAASGGGIAQDAGFIWDNTNKRLGTGASIGAPQFDVEVARSTGNSFTTIAVDSGGTTALYGAQYIASNNNGVVALFGATGSGYTAVAGTPNLGASTAFLLNNSGPPLYIGSTTDITFQTGGTQAEAMHLLITGEVAVPNKLVGGTTAAHRLILQGTTHATLRGAVTCLDPFGIGRDPGITGGAPMFAVAGNVSVNSGTSATLDWAVFNTSTVTVTGSTNITTATGFNWVTIQPPAYSTTVTIGAGGTTPAAATLVITGPPTISGGGAFAGTGPQGLWIQGIGTQNKIDGTLTLNSLNVNSNATIAGGVVIVGSSAVTLTAVTDQSLSKTSGGDLIFSIGGGGNMMFLANSQESFRLLGTGSLGTLQIGVNNQQNPGTTAGSITNLPNGVSTTPQEYWLVRGPSGTLRRIPLF